jgi:energy-coupling factor transporter transmembrane protein EcfT
LSDDVHMAMVARGYTGNVRTLAPTRVAARDVAWAMACVVTALLVLGGDRVLGG